MIVKCRPVYSRQHEFVPLYKRREVEMLSVQLWTTQPSQDPTTTEAERHRGMRGGLVEVTPARLAASLSTSALTARLLITQYLSDQSSLISRYLGLRYLLLSQRPLSSQQASIRSYKLTFRGSKDPTSFVLFLKTHV